MEALSALNTVHEVSRHDQFFMKLRSKFEVTQAALLNCNLVPTLDVCLEELLREEQRFSTLASMGQEKLNSEMINVAYIA